VHDSLDGTDWIYAFLDGLVGRRWDRPGARFLKWVGR
jgi:hypothetical protein